MAIKVLVVVAHPDDAEIAMGMRIFWYSHRGAHVRVHVLTGASSSGRMGECAKAAAILGVGEYTFSEIPDAQFNDNLASINRELFCVFRSFPADTVYTHYPNDQHLDHAATGREVTAVAMRFSANLTYFRSPYSEQFHPTLVFMGSHDMLEAKRAALECFESQKQIDMELFIKLAELTHRQYVHHRLIERFPVGAVAAELFITARRIEFGGESPLPSFNDLGLHDPRC